MMPYAAFALILAPVLAVLLWPPRGRTAWMIAAGVMAASVGLYHLVGTPEILPLMDARAQKLGELEHTIVTRSETVKAEPKNLEAWLELGQVFMETGQYGAAANAFKQAVVLSGGAPELIMAYARAMILEDSGEVDDQSKKSLQMVLLQRPGNPEARYFLAVRTLQEGKTRKAMREMRELYNSLSADSPLRAMIDRQIGRN